MFDKDLHKEFVFCSCLLYLLLAEPVDLVDLEGKLQLEYYKLQKTFDGTIALHEAKGVYGLPSKKALLAMIPRIPWMKLLRKLTEIQRSLYRQ